MQLEQVGSWQSRLAIQGFLHVESSGLAQTDLDDVAELLDPLFDRLDDLDGCGHDLAPGSSTARVPEVLHPIRHEPRLLQTRVYAFWSDFARSLLGPRSYLSFDHAIFKPAGPSAPTRWHQDSGYTNPRDAGIAIWIPLQDVGVEDGCMRFGVRSHLLGALRHAEQRSSSGAPVRSIDWDERDSVAVPVAAGGATIHTIHTVHSAGPNLGRTDRKVWILNAAARSPIRHTVSGAKRTFTRVENRPLTYSRS